MNMTRILMEKEQKYEFLENKTVVEMVGWHHQLDGHESEQAPGDGEGQKPGMLQSIGSHKVKHD